MKYMLMICDDESVISSPAEVHALPQITSRRWLEVVPATAEAGRSTEPYIYASLQVNVPQLPR